MKSSGGARKGVVTDMGFSTRWHLGWQESGRNEGLSLHFWSGSGVTKALFLVVTLRLSSCQFQADHGDYIVR